MKCPNCGNESNAGTRFCTECGYKFPDLTLAAEKEPPKTTQDPAPSRAPADGAARPRPARPAPQKSRNKKLICIAACAVAALIVIIAAITVIASLGNNSGYTTEIKTRYGSPDAHFLADSHGRCYDLSEYEITSYKVYPSLDGGTAAVLGKKQSSDKYGVLLLVSDERLSKIADDVYDCAISDNGASVAYATAGEDTGYLYLYNVKKQTAVTVSGGIPYANDLAGVIETIIHGSMNGMFVLSPDGKSIAFTKKVNSGTRAYVSVKGSEPTPIAADSYPVAISNGAKYVYYIRRNISLTDYNYKFSVGYGDELRNLSLDALYLGNHIIFNRDRTEVIFADDGVTYLSRKGGERQKLMDGEMSGIIVPGDGAARREELPYVGAKVDIYARKTIGGSLFVSNGGLYYLNRAFEISAITATYGGAAVAPDGRSLYYIDTSASKNQGSGSIFYLKDVERNGAKELVSSSIEATDIAMPDKADGVYVYDLDDTLWFVSKNGKKQKRICEEVSSWSVDVKSGGVWFTSELEDSDTVWYSSRGSKKKAVVKADMTEILPFDLMPRTVMFSAMSFNDSGSHIQICRVRSGKKWDVIAEYDIQM